MTREGQRVTQQTLVVAACRGIEESPTPPCGRSGYSPDEFPGAGYNTADIHSPLYYFLTAWLAAPLRPLGLSLLDAGRLAGAVWLAAGLIVLWKLCAELGAGPLARGAVCVIAATSLNVLEAAATINPDATALPVTGLATLAVLRWERAAWRAWPAPAAAFAATLALVHNVVGVGAVALYAPIRWAVRTMPLRRALTMGAAIAAAGVAGQLAWLTARHFLAVGSVASAPSIQAEHVDRLRVGNVIAELAHLFTPAAQPYVPGFLRFPAIDTLTALQNLALVAGAVGGFLYLDPRSRQHSAAAAVTAATLAGGPILVVATFAARHSFVPAFPRYGLSLLPLFAALLAVGLRNRFALALAWALGLASFAVVVYYMAARAL